jgi:hypothetical protein
MPSATSGPGTGKDDAAEAVDGGPDGGLGLRESSELRVDRKLGVRRPSRSWSRSSADASIDHEGRATSVGRVESGLTPGSRVAYRRFGYELSAVGGSVLDLRRHPLLQQRAVGVIASCLSILVAACVATPITHDPTAAGLVQHLESNGETTQFVLGDGRRIDLDLRRARPLYQGGVPPAVGDLILVGQDAEQQWFVGISPDSGGEYVLQSRGVTLDSAHVQLDSGLRLELGPVFRGPAGPVEADAPHRIVIDASGEVTSIT